MPFIRTTLTISVLTVTLASAAFAADGILLKERAGDNYCHMKFPALNENSLSSKRPSLKKSSTGDIIDYYGTCDESPTSANQILEQKHEEAFMFDKQYED